jgi:hypothetical protein
VTPDLCAAWLTAGNNLQPVVAWIARNWWWIASAIAALFAAWAIPKALRRADRQIAAIHADFDQTAPHREEDR